MFKRILCYSILFFLLFQAHFVYGGNLDAASQEALAKTKELLINAQKRAKKIDKDQNAQKADQMVKKLGMSPEQNQKIYELAASIFEKMIKENNGNADEVNKLLKQSPQSFANSLNKNQLKQLRQLATEIQKNQGKVPSP